MGNKTRKCIGLILLLDFFFFNGYMWCSSIQKKKKKPFNEPGKGLFPENSSKVRIKGEVSMVITPGQGCCISTLWVFQKVMDEYLCVHQSRQEEGRGL